MHTLKSNPRIIIFDYESKMGNGSTLSGKEASKLKIVYHKFRKTCNNLNITVSLPNFKTGEHIDAC